MGSLANIAELRHHYGLARQATESMIVIEAYKALRDRAPYPPDQVVKHLDGKFAFIIFDAKTYTLFKARVSFESEFFVGVGFLAFLLAVTLFPSCCELVLGGCCVSFKVWCVPLSSIKSCPP